MTASRKKRFFVRTYGCQMNVNDSERLVGLLLRRGMEPAQDARSADLVFFNTCAVREKAATKLHHALGRLKKLKTARPEVRIGVGGCVAQLEGESLLERAPHVDLLVGTHNLHRVPEFLDSVESLGRTAVDLDRRADAFSIPADVVAHQNPVRAYVTVMEGCNHVCSFCVVPRTRGPEVHRPLGEIVREVRSLVDRGFPEVMLLGQTVNAYRQDGVDFAGLLERVHAVSELQRLRFTTSHPEHVDRRMAEAFRDLPRLCPYLHLPFQSGSDRVLASMRRGYTCAEYLEKAELLRATAPGLVLSTDVIVGYPGETEREFEQTMTVLERVGFAVVYAFTYSSRPGTTAQRLADDVPPEEKSRRLQALNARQQRWQRQQHEALVGTVQDVLVESVDRDGQLCGRTPHFRIVHFAGGADLVGRQVSVEIVAAAPNSLRGRIPQAIH